MPKKVNVQTATSKKDIRGDEPGSKKVLTFLIKERSERASRKKDNFPGLVAFPFDFYLMTGVRDKISIVSSSVKKQGL